VRSAVAGQTCSIALNIASNIDINELYDSIKKGAVLTDRNDPPKLIYEFVVDFNLCNTSEETIINPNYEPVIFSETFKQTCSIEPYIKNPLKFTKTISKSKDNLDLKAEPVKPRSKSHYIDKDNWNQNIDKFYSDICLKPNTENILLVKFKFRPEYVKLGQKVVIYDNHLKATGIVTELIN